MLPCSVRRVAATAPQSQLLSNLPRAAATRSYTYRPSQRRRYSSSKPSRDNGSEDPVRQSVRPAAEAKTDEPKAPGEKRKRKTKDASDKHKYPSVPTTAHIPSDFLALSSFFSLHRPISVTRGLPRNVTEDAFASIFVTPSRSQKAADVVSTLSRTVADLEQPMSGLSLHEQQIDLGDVNDAQVDADIARVQKLQGHKADTSAAGISLQVKNMAGQFLPFRPPPLPQAETPASKKAAETAKSATAAAAAETTSHVGAEEDVQTRVYKAVFTIEETTDANGEIKIVAHSPELMEDPDASSAGSFDGNGSPAPSMSISVDGGSGFAEPRSFLERMALRQLKFNEALQRRRPTVWEVISVKRQRKLKMKKKKYKKLTRRLRHERLKHGRT